MKIQTKLSISLLATAAVITLYMVFFVQWNFGRGFLDYVNGVEDKEVETLGARLGDVWAEQGGWHFLQKDDSRLYLIYAESLPENELQKRILTKSSHKSSHWRVPQGPLPSRTNMPLLRRVYLFDRDFNQVYGYEAVYEKNNVIPVFYRNAVIGYLGHHPINVLSETAQKELVAEQKKATHLIGLAALLVTFGLSIPFARRFTSPLRELSAATRRLRRGDLTVRITPSTKDEIGQLGNDFNALANNLEQNEIRRKRWLSDISHELRTPLAVMQGEIEAIQDGIRPMNRDGLQNFHKQVLHINHLVEDLYQLSRVEGELVYHKEAISLKTLLQEVEAKFERQSDATGLHLQMINPPEDLVVYGDYARLQQVFDNLLHNSMRYTDAPGQIQLSTEQVGSYVRITVQDSAPTVEAKECGHIFDRLYRVEKSRNRNLGGAGIGLAVCKNIIDVHGGDIVAEPSPLGGLKVCFTLPLFEKI